MRLTSRSIKHGSKLDLPLTSMIDVVFLLLIYFLVTSSLIEEERELDSGIKVQRAAPRAADLAPAVINIVPGSSGYIYSLGGREITSAAELRSVLAQFENKVDGAFVRADDGAPFDMAASAIQACKDARFLSVSYVTTPATP
jgi:biopolymer transport protein ExbD